MKEFKNLSEFNDFLLGVVDKKRSYERNILDVAAQLVEDVAKRKFGIYQEGIGEYPEWDQLKDSTMEQRERLGYEPNNPLYRSGDLMHSIHHVVVGNTAVIGSDEDIMVWMEEGTVRVPARPVLGPAAFESQKLIKDIIVKGVESWLTGKPLMSRKI